jgi:Na+/melibiose symporter-like transporter
MRAFLIFAAAIAVSAVISLITLSRFKRVWSKVVALAVCLIFPILLYSVLYALEYDGKEGNFWGWWMTGIVMLSPIFGGWTTGSLVGAFLSRHFSVKID